MWYHKNIQSVLLVKFSVKISLFVSTFCDSTKSIFENISWIQCRVSWLSMRPGFRFRRSINFLQIHFNYILKLSYVDNVAKGLVLVNPYLWENCKWNCIMQIISLGLKHLRTNLSYFRQKKLKNLQNITKELTK